MRLFTDGAEIGDILFWSTTANVTAITGAKRSGDYGYYISGDGSGIAKKNFPASSEIYFHMAFVLTQADIGPFCEIRNSATTIAQLELNANRNLDLYVGKYQGGGVKVGTGLNSLLQNTWYTFDWHLNINNSTGISEVKIDGVREVYFTGDTQPGSDTQVDNIYLLGGGYGSGSRRYIDDIALNNVDNSDSLNDTSWCGDVHIERLPPSGNSLDGWVDNWIGSDSNSVDNYALVDEVPPAGADYIESETVGHQDRYALTNFDATDKIIKRLWVEARAYDVATEGNAIKLGLRLNNIDYLSESLVLAGTYRKIVGLDYKLNPNTSSPWTESEINAAQSVIETA